MPQKYIIVIALLFFVASTTFLFWQNNRELDPHQGKNWWTLAFVSPQESGNLSFVVENYTAQEVFEYEITADKTSVAKESFVAKRGDKTIVTPSFTATADKRTRVTVALGTEKKEIYR